MLMAPSNTKTVLCASANYTALAIPLLFGNGQPIPMGYLDELAALRKKRGLSQAKLAELVGVEQPTIQRWEKGKREPSLNDLTTLADALGTTPGAIIDGTAAAAIGPRLWVKGIVAAGVWQPAIERPQDEWQEFTGRSDVNAQTKHRFGLLIKGDSMNELYPEGTIIECVSVFGHAEIAPGKRVVIVRENIKGEYEATVKELAEQDGVLWARPRSYNPAHLPINLSAQQEGIVETRIAAIVVSSIRPE